MLNSQDSLNNLAFELKVIDSNSFTANAITAKYNFGENVIINGNNVRIDKTIYFNSSSIGQRFIIGYQNLENAAANYNYRIRVKQIGDLTRMLDVNMTSENPQLCVDVVNTLMKEYIANNVEENREVTIFTKKFIDERVANLEEEVKGIETSLKDFREKTTAINLDAQSQVYLTNLNNANTELAKQRLLIGGAKSLHDFFQSDPEVKNFAPIGILDDGNLQNLFLEYNNTQFKRKQMQEQITEINPSYQEKLSDLKRLRITILEGLSKILISSELTADDLEKTRRENIGKLDQIPFLQKELYNYDRDRKTKEELYLFLKKKGEEAGITSASIIPNSKTVDLALKNINPIEPIKSKIYSLAFFLGLLVPSALAYLIEVFNDKIRYRDDIQKQTKTPIVAEVGHNSEGQTLVVRSKSRKVIAEQFRMIRTNIQYLVGSKDKYTILVTSTFSGEGKSFISTNVSAAIALTGKKTVLLEFDLRKPKVLEGLKMNKSAGITNFVVGKAEIADIIKPVPGIDNLFVIGCGAIPPNPAELLLEDNVNVLFKYLKENFDAIVIDSAPVGLVTDSMTLSKFTDATLYIVRHKYTLKKQIKLIDELYVNNKLPKLSIVINDVVGSTGGYYGYGGYGYGYGRKSYGYGTGYFEEEQRSFFKDTWQKLKSFLLFWK
jgi:capsular exopolysaccharide synthesis family protein